MKKLMIAAAIVCAAVFAKASTYDWGAAALYLAQPESGGMTFVNSGTAYLFDQATFSQQSFIDAYASSSAAAIFAANGVKDTSSGNSVDTISIGEYGVGTGASAAFEYAESATLYAVVVSSEVPDAFYITAPINAAGSATPGDKVTLDPGYANMGGAAINTSGTYAGESWYGAAVPEPTSGLLLLLGVAGLALRRRRA